LGSANLFTDMSVVGRGGTLSTPAVCAE